VRLHHDAVGEECCTGHALSEACATGSNVARFGGDVQADVTAGWARYPPTEAAANARAGAFCFVFIPANLRSALRSLPRSASG
jgi:hypothetical protein